MGKAGSSSGDTDGFSHIAENLDRRRAAEREIERWYYVNLAILLVLIVVVTFWFYRHIHNYVTQSLLIGTPLTLWAIWKFIQPSLPERWRSSESLGQSVLNSPLGTQYLVLGFCFTFLMYITTASIYVEYDGTGDEGVYELEIRQDGKLFMEPLQVTSYDTVKGRPYLFNFGRIASADDLTVRIVKPLGFEDQSVTLGGSSRVHLQVPGSFTKKKYHICRIVPGRMMQTLPPRINGDDTSSCSLTLEHRPLNGAPKTYQVKNLLLECIYVGSSRDIVELMYEAEEPERRFRIMHNYELTIGQQGERARDLASILADKPRVLEIKDELQAGDTIGVTVTYANQVESSEKTIGKQDSILQIFPTASGTPDPGG